MNKIIVWGILGAIGGVFLGEFYPSLFSNGFWDSLGANMSQPFSPYRNHLAFQYGFWGVLLGVVVGFVLNSVQSHNPEKDRKKFFESE